MPERTGEVLLVAAALLSATLGAVLGRRRLRVGALPERPARGGLLRLRLLGGNRALLRCRGLLCAGRCCTLDLAALVAHLQIA